MRGLRLCNNTNHCYNQFQSKPPFRNCLFLQKDIIRKHQVSELLKWSPDWPGLHDVTPAVWSSGIQIVVHKPEWDCRPKFPKIMWQLWPTITISEVANQDRIWLMFDQRVNTSNHLCRGECCCQQEQLRNYRTKLDWLHHLARIMQLPDWVTNLTVVWTTICHTGNRVHSVVLWFQSDGMVTRASLVKSVLKCCWDSGQVVSGLLKSANCRNRLMATNAPSQLSELATRRDKTTCRPDWLTDLSYLLLSTSAARPSLLILRPPRLW